MRNYARAVAAAALVLMTAVPAQAGSWVFGLENRTNETVVGFRTKEDGAWSDNWLDTRIAPGEAFDMDFGSDEGDCVVRTQVMFADDSYFDYDVDYCKVSNLYIYSDEIVWD